jgi:hypothetical protein
MATTVDDDDFDMPELTDEMIAELKHTDLHLGPAQVSPVHEPPVESADLIGIIIGVVMGAMYLGLIWLFVKVWIWALFS